MRRISFTILLFVFLACISNNANALLISYSDRTAWEANVNDVVTETFDARPYGFYQTLNIGQVTFDVPERDSSDSLWIPTRLYDVCPETLVANYPTSSILATFNYGTTAVAADVFLFGDSTLTIQIVENSIVNTYSISVDYPNYSFFGVTSDNGTIQSIRFTPSNVAVAIDNFSYGNFVSDPGNTPVPEPTTLVLFGTGLAGLAGVSRRKFKRI